MEKCIVCDADVPDYEPQMCCNGYMCGCLGLPIEPPLCSKSCTEKVFGVERHGKWTKETVWIYRNDRGDIMRAQDEHPAAASEEVERMYRSDANESNHERL